MRGATECRKQQRIGGGYVGLDCAERDFDLPEARSHTQSKISLTQKTLHVKQGSEEALLFTRPAELRNTIYAFAVFTLDNIVVP